MGKKLVIPGADFSANAIEVTSIKTVSGNQSFQILDSVEGVKSLTSDAEGLAELEGFITFNGSASAINILNKAASASADTVVEKIKHLRLKTNDLRYGFYNCGALTEVTIDDIVVYNTTSITIQRLFEKCTNLEKLCIKAKTKIKVSDFSYVFTNGGGKKLLSLDLSHFDTSVLTNISGFFNIGSGQIPSIKELDFSGWDLSSLDTSVESNYQYAFNLCVNLEKAIINGCNAATITKLKTILSTVNFSNPWVWVESTDASGNAILVHQV